jgi:hypothetical protein
LLGAGFRQPFRWLELVYFGFGSQSAVDVFHDTHFFTAYGDHVSCLALGARSTSLHLQQLHFRTGAGQHVYRAPSNCGMKGPAVAYSKADRRGRVALPPPAPAGGEGDGEGPDGELLWRHLYCIYCGRRRGDFFIGRAAASQGRAKMKGLKSCAVRPDGSGQAGRAAPCEEVRQNTKASVGSGIWR